jgi:hypothetical protein
LPTELIYDANSWGDFAGIECDRVIRNVFGEVDPNGWTAIGVV